MTYHGVPKPGWRAFALLHSHAGGWRLPTTVTQQQQPQAAADAEEAAAAAAAGAPGTNVTLISAFATQQQQQQPDEEENNRGGGFEPVSVFLSFWENGGPDSYRDNRTVTVKLLHTNTNTDTNTEDPQEDTASGRAGLLSGPGEGQVNVELPLGPSKVTEYRIDESHANPLAAWEAMGSPDEPTAEQLKQLIDASVVHPEPLALHREAVQGGPHREGARAATVATVTMPPNSAVVLVFS